MNLPRIAVNAAIALLSAYAGVCGYVYMKQDRLVFPQIVNQAPPRHHMTDGFQRMRLTTPDGETLTGLLAMPLLPLEPSPTLVITFGGNAHDVGNFAIYLRNEVFPTGNVVVAAFNYRGYTSSATQPSTGTPSEETLFDDALQVYDALVARLKPSRTFVLGYSLGSAVATYTAVERPVSGTLLIAPFTHMGSLAANQYPWLTPAIPLLLKHPFDTEDRIGDVSGPVTIVHTHTDGLIPDGQAEALARAARDRLREITAVEGTTHGTLVDAEQTQQILRAAVAE